MSITDELREWAERGLYYKERRDELTAIADRIDAEAEDNERFRREAGPFCDRLREAAVECADVTLFGVDYIALPVDADGVPIHIGDVMEWCDSGETLTVDGIGRDVLFYIDGVNAEWIPADSIRHRHEPTVEKERPDSLDRIADELEKWCDRVDVDGDACGKPRDLAKRIRRLAKKDDDDGPF